MGFLVFGCDKKQSDSPKVVTQEQVEALSSHIEQLEGKIEDERKWSSQLAEALSKTVTLSDRRLSRLEDDKTNSPNDIEKRLQHMPIWDTALLTSSDKGYSPLYTNSGVFFVALESAEPYLDGYKIRLRVGNLQSVTYLGFSLSLSLSGRKDRIEATFPDRLNPGSWTIVEILSPKTNAKELSFMTATLNVAQAALREPTDKEYRR